MLWRKWPSSWVVWGGAWVTFGLTLLFVLPVRPNFSIPFAGSTRFERFVEPDLALIWRYEEGPRSEDGEALMLVNLASGAIEERRFTPSNREREEIPPIPETDPIDSEETESGSGDDDGSSGDLARLFGTTLRPSRYPLRKIIGDVLVETRDGLEQSRLTVWNWRTGQERYRREFAGWGHQIGALGGNRIMLRVFDPTTEDTSVKVFEIASGAEVPTSLPKNTAIDFPSPDGRWLLRPRSYPNQRIEAWNMERGTLVFTAEADLFEFFPDSRRLATVVHRDARSDTPTRIWRVHDLERGAIVAERQETLPPDRVLASELLVQEGERILAYGRSRNGTRDSVDIWSWNDDGMATIRARQRIPGARCGGPVHLERSFGRPRDPDFPPPFVIDGQNVIDLATRLPCGTLPPEGFSSQVAPGWAIVSQEPGPVPLWLAKVASPLARPLFRSKLVDLTSGKPVATLATNNDRMARFSPDGRTLIETGDGLLTVWRLPPSRPFLTAFLGSLACPLLAVLITWLRVRRRSMVTVASETRGPDRPGAWRTLKTPDRRRSSHDAADQADEPAWLADPTGILVGEHADLFSAEPPVRGRNAPAGNLGVP